MRFKRMGRSSASPVTLAVVLAIAAGLLVAGTVSASGASQGPALVGSGDEAGLRATILRTSHGIPHIVADDFPGLGYGYGYALAQDNLCVLADTYVTVNGDRSRYFGPDGSYSIGGNGTTNNNLNSDFFYQRIKDKGTIEDLLELAPPRGPRPEIIEAVRGYVAGYNRYLRDTGVDNLPDPRCRGAAWVREITEMDAFRRFYQLGLIASQGVAIDGVGGAQPPVGEGPALPTPAELQGMISQLGQELPLGGIGSNAVALGKDATDNGRGMMLGNPHFPWDGSERFYEAQLTIPGRMNVEGASLFGVPVINIGHTENLAWSHTVSTAYRFTPFEERLVPGSPTSYIYDGQVRQMSADDVTVTVKNADGSLSERSRRLYSTHHGPVFTSLLGLPIFPWTPTTAWSMGDANAGNFRYLNHFFEVNQAQSVDELYEILQRNQGVPWVNTLAADSSGKAFYADISVTPHVTDEKAQLCNTEVGRATFAALGLPVLDGSLSTCEWGEDGDAIEPGIFGPGNMPHLFRDDYVTNSNDSYWLSNPEEPLTGFDRIIGDEETERALRTRSGLVMVEQRLNGTDGQPGNRFTRQQLQDMVFANRQYAGELWRDELAAFCEATPTMTGTSGPVDVSAACPVLRAWDVHDNLDSNGAILFRLFASNALGAVPVAGTPGLYTTQFDAADGVHTPSGLNTANPAVEQSFADAVQTMRDSNIPLDAPLRGWQYERRGAEAIPIHGGPGGVGVFNAINVGFVDGQGYPNVPHGSSFVMAAQFTGGECPVDTRTILTYSQSTNPSSPYFADQTRMFSNKEWVREAFCKEDILADPNLERTDLNGGVSATYDHPQQATTLRTAMVPAFRQTINDSQCLSRGGTTATHGAPLALPGCSPPAYVPGTIARQGPRSSGIAELTALPGDPSTVGDEADLGVSLSLSDVRDRQTNADYAPNAGGPDVTLVSKLRLTDTRNGPGETDPGTVVDFDYAVGAECIAVANPIDGSVCSLSTSADAVTPGTVKEGSHMVLQAFRMRVNDAGQNGVIGNADDRNFSQQGIYIP
jgi:acyl-homoserine-lactone acylase